MPHLKLKRFPSYSHPTHWEAASRDNGEPRSTNNDSIGFDKIEYTSQPNTSFTNGLKNDQAEMIWRSDGKLVGKVQDDSLASPEELEGHSLSEKGEELDEEKMYWHRPQKPKTDFGSVVSQDLSTHPG